MKARTLLLWNTVVSVTLEVVRWFGEKGRSTLKRTGRHIAARTKPVWNPLWQRYRTWPTFRQRFAVSFALGILIEASVHFFGHGLPPVVEWQRWARDKTIALTRLYRQEHWIDTTPLPGGFSRFVLIDIDDATWRDEAWGGGEPFLQPRDKVLALVDRAFDSGARVVYLDILLEGTIGKLETEWLKKIAAKKFSVGGQRHLLVARSLRQPLDADAKLQMRPALWDSYPLHPGGVAVQSVVPMFPLDFDLRVREWHIGQEALTPDGSGKRFYASPQLALYCLRDDNPGGDSHTGLIPWCEQSLEARPGEHTSPISDNGHNSLASTILFPLGSKGQLGYSRWPALAVLDNDSLDVFQDAIVVIGASFLESRDHYFTPVGRLAGSVLNLNAMDTMLRHGQLHELPWHTKLPLALLIIGVVAAIFAFGKRLAAVVASTVVVFGMFAFVIGPWLLLHGLWFDFGAPLLGIQLHRSIEEFLDGRKQSRSRNSNSST